MKEVYLSQVIISAQLRRGEGVEGDPVRRITQVFTVDGELIAEYDPFLTNLPQGATNQP